VGAEAQEITLLTKHYPANLIATISKDSKSEPANNSTQSQPVKPANLRRKANILSVAVCALVIPGLFSTMALPAYGASIGTRTDATAATTSASGTSSAEATAQPQSLTVEGSTEMGNGLQRSTVKYIAPRRRVLTQYSPTKFRAVDLSGIAGIAARYLGVPYRFGGESPAGFDCSGLVAYVYAQVGIHLPHSAAEQGRMGTRVSRAAAVPGDVVVMNGGSHVGIYIGGDKMIDAPEPGRRVSVDKIYDNDYYFVRF
jgi:cell wall-associated NlpC family hydrolase